MIEAPVGLAFAAGLVATVNPCGFAMLPAYLSYFLGLDDPGDDRSRPDDPDDPDRGGRRGRPDSSVRPALEVGGTVSAGFLVVFGITGLLINAGVRSIIDWIPFVALGVGVVMVVLGIAVVRGFELSIGVLKAGRGASSRDRGSVFAFGVSYAVASLSCTLPVFLSVVVGSIASTSFVGGLVAYLAYGAGMSVMLLGLTLALAFAKQGVVRAMRRLLPHVQRISGALLIVAGVYIVWFWVDDLTSDAGEQGTLARIVEGWSASITNWTSEHSTAVGVVLGAVIALSVLSVVLRRFEPDEESPAGAGRLDTREVPEGAAIGSGIADDRRVGGTS